MKEVPLKPGHYWKGYKIKLYPTAEQAAYMDECINLSRFVYNWAISKQEEIYQLYKEGKSTKREYSVIDLNSMISEFRNDPKNKWLRTLSLTACRYQILAARNAYNRFFSKTCKNKRPKFKKKKNCIYSGSYPVRPDRMNFKNSLVKIDGLSSWIETKWDSGWYGYYDYINNNGKLTGTPEFHNAHIVKNPSCEYFICFHVQVPIINQTIEFVDDDHVIGIDLNIDDRFVCSNGYRSGSPDLKRLNRHKSKKESRYSKDINRRIRWEKANPGKDYEESNRAKKRHHQYTKSEQKIADTVETFIQTETKKVIDMGPRIVCMEHNDVEDMKQTHSVAKELQQANFYRCREVMKYKCEKNDITFVEADRYFPSSQLCSRCGTRHKIVYTTKEEYKTYTCPNCGLVIDRDDNAALNLQKYALDADFRSQWEN